MIKRKAAYALVGGLYSDTTFNGASYINLGVSPDLYGSDIGVGISYL